MNNDKVLVKPYKRIAYAILSVLMFLIPLFYFQSLKDTPFLGFNNTTTNTFIYVVIAFFSLFSGLGILFLLLTLKKKEKSRPSYEKSSLIRALDIMSIIVGFVTLIYLIAFYNKIIFFLLVPTAIFLILIIVNSFKQVTNNKIIFMVGIVFVINIILSSFISVNVISGQIKYKKQHNHLSSIVDSNNVIYNQYGGWDNYNDKIGVFDSTGFFHIAKQNERYWFIDPLGKPFISKGVNHVDYHNHSTVSVSPLRDNVVSRYATPELWGESAIKLLRDRGFNTITAWSHNAVMNKDMPYTILLDFGNTYLQSDPNALQYNAMPGDYFSEDFEIHTDTVAQRLVEPYRDSEYLLGYFTDNELIWGIDWRNIYTLIEVYMSYSNDAPGKTALINMLIDNTSSVSELNSIFGTNLTSYDDLWTIGWDKLNMRSDRAKEMEENFGALVAERYAKVTHDAIRQYDNNHLILGCRFAFYPNESLFLAANKYTDVVSFAGYFESYYYTYGSKEQLEKLYGILDKPFIINEYGVRALDANMPSFLYSGPVVFTEQQRAVESSVFMESFMYQPYAIGYHWYKYADNELFGLLNGENYGLIDKDLNEYETFNNLMELTNNSLEIIHISEEREIRYKSPKLWG